MKYYPEPCNNILATHNKIICIGLLMVFICHSSADKLFARRLSHDLKRHGLKIWLDEEAISIGESIRESIERALEEAMYIVVLLSPSSIRRNWVRKEISAAVSLEAEQDREIILPVRLKPCAVPRILKDRRYADFSQGYSAGLKQLLKALPTASSGLGDLKSIKTNTLVVIRTLNGAKASVSKKQSLLCKAGIVDRYIEKVSWTGSMTGLRVTPGKVGRIWEEAGKHYIEHLFPKKLTKGCRIIRTMTYQLNDTFIDEENYYYIEVDYQAMQVGVRIIFPKGHPPIDWKAFENRGIDSTEQPTIVQRSTKYGKPSLIMNVNSPNRFSTYILRWNW